MSRTIKKSGKIYIFHNYNSEGVLREKLGQLTGVDFVQRRVKTKRKFKGKEIDDSLWEVISKYLPEKEVKTEEVDLGHINEYLYLNSYIRGTEAPGINKKLVKISETYLYSMKVGINSISKELSTIQKKAIKKAFKDRYKSFLSTAISIDYIAEADFPQGTHKTVMQWILKNLNSYINERKLRMTAWATSVDCSTEMVETEKCEETEEFTFTG
jgi:hypothetical protein